VVTPRASFCMHDDAAVSQLVVLQRAGDALISGFIWLEPAALKNRQLTMPRRLTLKIGWLVAQYSSLKRATGYGRILKEYFHLKELILDNGVYLG
jgi:hypothetical protein